MLNFFFVGIATRKKQYKHLQLNVDYSTVFSLAPFVSENIVTLIGICLLIGAMAKSSQVGLHVWLPMAMEGPTPVSALIHAATMVTAGVYLLMRTSPLIEYSSTVLILCLWVGAITTVFSSLIGLFQQDIKKVIAYSTMSQLAREYLLFRHQTICVEIIVFSSGIANKKKITINSQITKAHDYSYYNHISINFFNSFSALFYNLRQYFCILGYTVMSVKWKVITISKLVGISEAIRLILIYFILIKFSTKTKTFILAIINYTTVLIKSWQCFILLLQPAYAYYENQLCYYSCFKHNNPEKFVNKFNALNLLYNNDFLENNLVTNKKSEKAFSDFNEWLAGLIDGDGYFILTKKGYVSCEITMDIRDKKALYELKQKYGGTIKPVSNANALKYKLRHKKGLIALINAMNGLIRNPIRMLQMNKLCVKYGIEIKYPKPLTYYNGWLSGFIDSDGSVYFNEKSGQVFITISQKNRFLLEPLIRLYGGRIDILSPKIEAFKYIVYRKKELFGLLDNYFNTYPLKTKKLSRINLIKQFFCLRIHNNNNTDIIKYNEWISFKDKWEKYND